MYKVLIIQRSLPHYRADFFNQLKQQLDKKGVVLTLVYGKLKNKNSLKKDEVDLEWAHFLPSTIFHIRGEELYWQPSLPFLKDQDLVIVEQANKNLINYILMVRRLFSKQRMALWGHGYTMQASESTTGNRFKKMLLTKCDWWFAYTNKVKKFLVANGFPAEKITTVQNSIDTMSLIRYYQTLTMEDAKELKNSLGIQSTHIGVFCGGIYKEKCMDFLIQACDEIKKQITDFHLIIIGSGPDVGAVNEATKTRSWVHYVGPKFGVEKARYFKASALFLMPGLVGLGILDSFAMQTPMVTTNYPYHSPEIEYLEDGINGLMTENTVESYAKAVVSILKDSARREKLVEGCQKSSDTYTIEKMAENFSEGIIRCLQYYPK